jgi:large subunit ribosomal protein L4
MYKGAMRSILSELVRQDRLVAVSEFTLTAPKTKELIGKLKDLELKGVLVVTEQPDENLYLASRNLYEVDVCDANEIDPVSLIGYEKILVTSGALKQLEERLS